MPGRPFERLGEGASKRMHAALHNALFPGVVTTFAQLARAQTAKRSVTSQVLALLRARQQRMTMAQLAEELGIGDTREGRGSVASALHKLRVRGNVTRHRGTLAGITGPYWWSANPAGDMPQGG